MTNRAVELASKLQFPENAHLRKRTHLWIEESAGWAETMVQKYGFTKAQQTVEGYRLLYVLNHLCPALHHFHRRPDPWVFRGDLDGYDRAAEKHLWENTQAGRMKDGKCIQESVRYDVESFEAFCAEVEKFV